MNDRQALERIYEILKGADEAGDACLLISEVVAKMLMHPNPLAELRIGTKFRFATHSPVRVVLQHYNWGIDVTEKDRIDIEAGKVYMVDYMDLPRQKEKQITLYTQGNVKLWKNGELMVETKGIGQ